MSCCDIPTYDICLTRGTTFALGVGFAEDPYGIGDNPILWSGVIAFRMAQNDALTPLLTMTAPVLLDETVRPAGSPTILWIMNFGATVAQTAALPRRNLVAFCEIVNSATTFRRRLWQGTVFMGD